MTRVDDTEQEGGGDGCPDPGKIQQIQQMVANQHSFTKEKWMIGIGTIDGADKKNSRIYIIHTQFPRFIARAVLFTTDGRYGPNEMPADCRSFPVCRIDDEIILCEVTLLENIKNTARNHVLLEEAMKEAAEVFRKTQEERRRKKNAH